MPHDPEYDTFDMEQAERMWPEGEPLDDLNEWETNQVFLDHEGDDCGED